MSRIAADITPLRDIFNSLFFVSMGMLVDTSLWLERPLLMLGLVAAVILGKAVIAGFVGFVALRSVAGAVMVGVGLAQIGEFSFVLLRAAAGTGLMPEPREAGRLLADAFARLPAWPSGSFLDIRSM